MKIKKYNEEEKKKILEILNEWDLFDTNEYLLYEDFIHDNLEKVEEFPSIFEYLEEVKKAEEGNDDIVKAIDEFIEILSSQKNVFEVDFLTFAVGQGFEFIRNEKGEILKIFEIDWNGEKYTNSTTREGKETGRQFKPIIFENDGVNLEVVGYIEL